MCVCVCGGGGGGPHGAPTSWLINPIKSRESMGTPPEEGGLSSSSSPFTSQPHNRKCRDSCRTPAAAPPASEGSCRLPPAAGWWDGRRRRRDGTSASGRIKTERTVERRSARRNINGSVYPISVLPSVCVSAVGGAWDRLTAGPLPA